jgi:hypothetical protein
MQHTLARDDEAFDAMAGDQHDESALAKDQHLSGDPGKESTAIQTGKGTFKHSDQSAKGCLYSSLTRNDNSFVQLKYFRC